MDSPGNPHTTTAYHPRNANHSLRIPQAATPWDSGFLLNPGDRFEVTLTVEGVYDYFCLPHEAGGMVGRIVVGVPGGPGTLPFDYFIGRPATRDWRPVPAAARSEEHTSELSHQLISYAVFCLKKKKKGENKEKCKRKRKKSAEKQKKKKKA